MLEKILLGIGLAYVAGEIYKNYVPAEKKQEWENAVKMHHGEAGVLTAVVGVLTKSPKIISVGIGLALHDRDDANKWFTGDKT